MVEQDLFYIKFSIVANIIMFIIFGILHISHFRFFKVKQILRMTLIHGIVAGLIGVFILQLMYSSQVFPIIAVSIINFVLFCTIIFAYGSMGPIMADRSVSVFLLILLDENDEGTGSSNYMADRLGGHAMFDKRFIEHEEVGAITIKDDTLQVTSKGKRIARFYLFLINLLKLKKNY